MLLSIVAIVFIVIAVYVSAIVTANTFATIVAGRARTIALLRLLGSSAGRSAARSRARAVRRPRRHGDRRGVGTGVAIALGRIAIATGVVPESSYGFWDPVLILPLVGVVLTTWLASWVGSRRVLTVTPLQALGGSEELEPRGGRAAPGAQRARPRARDRRIRAPGARHPGRPGEPARRARSASSGGILSFTGIVLARRPDHAAGPPAGRPDAGRSAAARLAAENALRHPQRSSRTTIGLVIGVTLLMTFGVAMATWQQIILAAQEAQPEIYEGIDRCSPR